MSAVIIQEIVVPPDRCSEFAGSSLLNRPMQGCSEQTAVIRVNDKTEKQPDA